MPSTDPSPRFPALSPRLALAVLLALCLGLPVHAAEQTGGGASAQGSGGGTVAADGAPPQAAPQLPQAAQKRSLDARVQDLKKQAKALNRDLFILEEELLFPSNTQLAVFLSVDVGSYFRLDSVQLKIDGKEVANHLYTKRELDALERGGVQRLWLGNVKSGEHELVATFTGPGPNNRDYRRATTVKFKKRAAAKYLELQIRDVTSKLQPEFVVREWE